MTKFIGNFLLVLSLALPLSCHSSPKNLQDPKPVSKSCADQVHQALKHSQGSMKDFEVFENASKACQLKKDLLNPKDLKLKSLMSERCLEEFNSIGGSLARSQNALCHLLIDQYWYELKTSEITP